MAVLWVPPAAIFDQVVNEPICVGLDLVVVSPNPNCPVPLAPQDHRYAGVGGGGGICTALNDPFMFTPEIVSAILFFLFLTDS
jgi:hypothetical protein